MDIVYIQNEKYISKILDISNCYLKCLSQNDDKSAMISKFHYHNEFEVHIVIDGYQKYLIDNDEVNVEKGTVLIISPFTKHSAVAVSSKITKYSVTFSANYSPKFKYFFCNQTKEIEDSLQFIGNEYKNSKFYSESLIEGRIFEIILLLFRITGYQESKKIESNNGDSRIVLAKKYIADNIENRIYALDVANYCHISVRQLDRIFNLCENKSVTKYIKKVKMEEVRKEIISTDISINKISEKYNFGDEYYFNRDFRKHFGMPPGEYRNMYQEKK